MTSGFPRSLDTIYGAAETFAEHVKAMSGGNFEIEVFPAGEIVPMPQAAEAVGTGTVEMTHTCSYYYWGVDPTFAIGTAVPFGLNARLMNSWLYEGGGNDAAQRLLRQAQPLRHARRQHRRADGRLVAQGDQQPRGPQGVKMRIAGIAGKVVEKLGVVPQQIPGGDIYPGARARHDRRGGVGRALRRREARLQQGGALLLLPGLLGGRADASTSSSTSTSGTRSRRRTRRS